MNALDDRLEKAKLLLGTGDYERALSIYESIIEDQAGQADLSPYFGAAYIYEHELSSKGNDLSRALAYYQKCVSIDESSGGAVSLAIARVLFKAGNQAMADEVIKLCRSSIDIKESPQAHMLLGTVYEYWLEQPIQARIHFAIAYKMGMQWGLRFYARSLIRSRKYILGALAHLRASLISPIYFLRRGDQSIFG